jgi:hypothetical protein
MRAGGLAFKNLIQPTISLEMPVPSQGHYGFHSFPVVDWFCLLQLFYFTFTDNVRLLDIYKTIARNYEIIGHSK